jgi:hypothetical protein
MTVDMIVWVAPMAALVGTALGAWLVNHFSGKRWQSQQQWAIREKRYTDLLTQLTQAQMSLQLSEYYEEPGSEHQDYRKDERFTELGRTASDALHAVEALAGHARLFLSQAAIDVLDMLIREGWHAALGALHPGEYIDKALLLVRTAQAPVLAATKADLSSAGA